MSFHTESIIIGLIASVAIGALLWLLAGKGIGAGLIIGGLLMAAFLFVLRKKEETQ